MLFFPCGGKLKIHFRTAVPLPASSLRASAPLHTGKGRKKDEVSFTEKHSCSIDNSDTHALCTSQ